jgi:thiol-disulfide isomerase/thioredoxin
MKKEVGLADFRGRNKPLLLFWSPDCGFCQDMLPNLKELETNPPAGAPEILVVSEARRTTGRWGCSPRWC